MIHDFKTLARQLLEEPEATIYDAGQKLFNVLCTMKDTREQVLGWMDLEHQVWFILFAEVWNGQT